jgi:hypothetical protein
MLGGKAERIEAAVDNGAAALFAGAVGYALFKVESGAYPQPQLGLFCAVAAAIAFLLCARGLRAVQVEDRSFVVPALELPAIEPGADELLLTEQVELLLTEQVELVLTDADRLQPPIADELLLTELADLRPAELLLTEAQRLPPAKPHPGDELALDDIIAELGSSSRVVRLFDPAAMPTPGQLNDRIERHLAEAGPAAAPKDDAQALYDALAELRRSLR